MAPNNLFDTLANAGLVDADLAAAAGLLARGAAKENTPLAMEDLLALAEITPEDVARAAADWDATSGQPGLLDAKPVSKIPPTR